MLFSDPTGSGRSDPVQIFVQGQAVCADEPTTSPAGLEEYWSMLFFRQPSGRAFALPVVRSLTGWYYTRLLITVTRLSVAKRPAGSVELPAGALPPGSPELAGLRFAVVRGRITRAGAGDWLLVPDRVISPAGTWAQYRALARHAADRRLG